MDMYRTCITWCFNRVSGSAAVFFLKQYQLGMIIIYIILHGHAGTVKKFLRP
jgi:hypothetical protein